MILILALLNFFVWGNIGWGFFFLVLWLCSTEPDSSFSTQDQR